MATEPVGIYPLSTQDGQDIPLDVVKPLSLIFYNLAVNADKTINVPVGAKIAYIYSRVDCLIRFKVGAFPALVQGTVYDDTIFIPAGIPITVVVTPGEGHVIGFATGTIYFSYIEQWAALSQLIQSSIG